MGPAEVAQALLEASASGGSGAVAVLVGRAAAGVDGGGAAAGVGGGGPPGVDGSYAAPGDRLLLLRSPTGEEEWRGSLGGGALEEQARVVLREALDDRRGRDGIRTVDVDGAEIELYVETRRAVRELVVVGAGHVAQPMAHVGALLGYRVTVLDDRPDFATRERFPDAHRLLRVDFSDPFADVLIHDRTFLLLVTRGHKYDYECLVRALRSDPSPAYIGMIGSRRRVRATYVQLVEEGFTREAIGRIHAPVGLDVGAETPEEIAVAVAAELVMLDRGGSGRSLREIERVSERFFPEDA